MDFGQRVALLADGPAHLRFILQPIIALLLGVQAGRLDVRAGAPPYGMRMLFGDHQRDAVVEGLKQLALPLVLAVGIDLVVSLLLFGRVYLLSSLLIGVLLVGLPYSAARGLTNRFSHRPERTGLGMRGMSTM